MHMFPEWFMVILDFIFNHPILTVCIVSCITTIVIYILYNAAKSLIKIIKEKRNQN